MDLVISTFKTRSNNKLHLLLRTSLVYKFCTLYDDIFHWWLLNITLCDKSLAVTCGRYSLVSSINKTDHHDITEILLKVALNTITLTP